MRISRAVVLLAAVLTIAGLTTSAPGRASSVTAASYEPTVDLPAAASPQPVNVQERKLGTVLSEAGMLLDPALAAVATGQRISYVSSNPDGKQSSSREPS